MNVQYQTLAGCGQSGWNLSGDLAVDGIPFHISLVLGIHEIAVLGQQMKFAVIVINRLAAQGGQGIGKHRVAQAA